MIYVSECSACVFFQEFYSFWSYIQVFILILFFYMVLENTLILVCSVFSAPLIGDCLFSIVQSCLLCHRLITHQCVGLFLVSLLCSIDPHVCLCQHNTVLMTVALQYSLKSDIMILPALFFFLKIVFTPHSLLYFHTNFKIICSSSVKNALGVSHRNYIEFVDSYE